MTSVASPKVSSLKSRKPGLFSLSKKPRLHFITINPNKGSVGTLRVNKIGKWSDYLRRFSSNYFIVREQKNNIHFHILASLDTELKFIKGIHFNVRPVSDKSKYVDPSESYVAEAERLGGMIEAGVLTTGEADTLLDAFVAKQKQEQRDAQRRNKSFLQDRKDNKLFNIFKYMCKEDPCNIYEDYVFCFNGEIETLDELKPITKAPDRD